MALSFEVVLVSVFRQVLVEKADIVIVGDRSYPVTRTKAKKLRRVFFEYDGKGVTGIEQNPNTKSMWAKLAKSGRSVMQFMSGRQYLAVIVDEKVTLYKRVKK